MQQLLAYYEEKQGRVVERNMFTAAMFLEQVEQRLIVERGNNVTPGTKRGYAAYTEHEELKWFESMDLGDFKRVFFFREEPDLDAAGLAGYERFTPERKVEFVQPMDHVPRNGPREYRRKPERRKLKVAFVLTLVGLTLIILGGGAWWALESNKQTGLEEWNSIQDSNYNARITAESAIRIREEKDSLENMSSDTNSAPQYQVPTNSDTQDTNRATHNGMDAEIRERGRHQHEDAQPKDVTNCDVLCRKVADMIKGGKSNDEIDEYKSTWPKDCPCH
jgi:hypothetical protein